MIAGCGMPCWAWPERHGKGLLDGLPADVGCSVTKRPGTHHRGERKRTPTLASMIENVHERQVRASPAAVGELLDSLSAKDDRLWPRGEWPSMRLDKPLQVGAAGGHGPVRYVVESYEPGRSVRFRFTAPSGFHGHHTFTISEGAGGSAVLRHELTMTVTGWSRITWPLFFRPLHDALIEDSFDRAESEVGKPPSVPARRSRWVRVLRSLASGRSNRPSP